MAKDFGPSGSLERQPGFASLREAVDMAHLQEHARSLTPAIVLALQIAIEEGFLQQAPVFGIKMRPVLEAVRLEPFFRGSRAHKAFEIAAGMQTLTAPIRSRKKRHRHHVPLRRASPVV